MYQKIRYLYRLMEGQRKLYLLAILCIAVATLLSFVAPLILRVTIDSILGSTPLEDQAWMTRLVNLTGGRDHVARNLWLLGLAMLVSVAFSGWFTFLKGKLSATASEEIARRLKNRLFDHIQRLPFAWHARIESGDIIQRCTTDVETIRKFLAMQAVEMGRTLFLLALVIPVMIQLDWRMTLVAMVSVPILFTFSFIFFMKVRKAFQLADEADGALSSTLQENLTGIRVVKAFHRQNFEKVKYDERNVDLREKVRKLIRLLAAFWSVSDGISIAQMGLLMIVGAWWAVNGRISVGTLVVFMIYEDRLLWPVRHLGRILTDVGKTVVSVGRIRDILDHPVEDETGGFIPDGKADGAVEFEDVRFSYNDGHPVLRDISFRVNPGETVAILGPTGSGKSTLVGLMPRLYDYQEGSVRIDGRELKGLNRKWVRSQIGIVLQEPFLFSRTIRENVALAVPGAGDDLVHNATGIASVHDVILSFEKGYETLVGERGVTLSGGQKQRVAIARSLVQDTPILIFDDSLSAVDTHTDRRIRHALRQRKGRATTFIIAHRLTTLSEADRIIVLEEGRITQMGTHLELLLQEGLYKRIWNIQNALEQDVEAEMVDASPNGDITAEAFLEEETTA